MTDKPTKPRSTKEIEAQLRKDTEGAIADKEQGKAQYEENLFLDEILKTEPKPKSK